MENELAVIPEIKAPRARNQKAQNEIDKAQKSLDAFDAKLKNFDPNKAKEAPKKETEHGVQLSQKDIEKSQEIYLKPHRWHASKEPFIEKFRSEYDFAKEMVRFVASNNEIKGDTIELCTKPFPGCPVLEWKIPVGKPVWGPRYLAERLKDCTYSELHTDQNAIRNKGNDVTDFGDFVVEKKINRLDATPVTNSKSVFLSSF